MCATCNCNAGPGESTTDLVFLCHNLIYEKELMGEQFLAEDTLCVQNSMSSAFLIRTTEHTFGESRHK